MTVRKPNESDIDYALRAAREFASGLSQYDGVVLPKAAFSRARDIIGLIGEAERAKPSDHWREANRELVRKLKDKRAEELFEAIRADVPAEPGSIEAFSQGRVLLPDPTHGAACRCVICSGKVKPPYEGLFGVDRTQDKGGGVKERDELWFWINTYRWAKIAAYNMRDGGRQLHYEWRTPITVNELRAQCGPGKYEVRVHAKKGALLASRRVDLHAAPETKVGPNGFAVRNVVWERIKDPARLQSPTLHLFTKPGVLTAHQLWWLGKHRSPSDSLSEVLVKSLTFQVEPFDTDGTIQVLERKSAPGGSVDCAVLEAPTYMQSVAFIVPISLRSYQDTRLYTVRFSRRGVRPHMVHVSAELVCRYNQG